MNQQQVQLGGQIFHGGIQLMSFAIRKCLKIRALVAVKISTNEIGDFIAALYIEQ